MGGGGGEALRSDSDSEGAVETKEIIFRLGFFISADTVQLSEEMLI